MTNNIYNTQNAMKQDIRRASQYPEVSFASLQSLENRDVPPILFHPYYLKCINLAQQSKSRKQRYGSIIVDNDGSIIGEGYNRAIAHSSFGTLPRLIRQGYANHAEIEALNNALMNGHDDLTGTTLFVAGYLPETGLLYFKDDFTCVKCPPLIAAQGISKIQIPTASKWTEKHVDQALLEGKKFVHDREVSTHEKRLQVAQGQYTIGLIHLLTKGV